MLKMAQEEFEQEMAKGRHFIPLGHGYFAEVDEWNVLWLLEWSWCYNKITNCAFAHVKYQMTEMHKYIGKKMGLVGQIDHKDRDRLNNKEKNLRESTQSQNIGNSKIHKDNRTGFKGVTYLPRDHRYAAQIMKDGKRYYCTFETARDASEWYQKISKILFGEFSPYD